MNFLKYENFIPAEKIIGYEFENKALLVQAFTRSSYTEEGLYVPDNEVLEFVGDSVLGALVVKCLANRYRWKKPIYTAEYIEALEKNGVDSRLVGGYSCDFTEAQMSERKISLVRSETLADAIERAGLEKFLLMSRGDEENGVREERSVKEDLFEAIVGAIIIDSGWDFSAAEAFINRILDPETRLEEGLDGEPDYEAELAAWFAKKGEEPRYEPTRVIHENLPIALSLNLGADMASYEVYGHGRTEAGARRMAAKEALEFINDADETENLIISTVGKPKYDNAVNQLQELWQKKIINKPEYVFREEQKNKSGNPSWSCRCVIEGQKPVGGAWVLDSKAEAKKSAAYEMLMQMCGKI